MRSGGYQGGEIVLLSFPFADATGARVTSQPLRDSFDVEIMDWGQAGLLLPSIVRLDKVATLEKRLVERRLGRLATNDWTQARAVVQRLWASI